MPGQAAMAHLPERAESDQTPARSWLPWILRLSARVLAGEAVGLHELDADEQRAVLEAALELVPKRRRPGAA